MKNIQETSERMANAILKTVEATNHPASILISNYIEISLKDFIKDFSLEDYLKSYLEDMDGHSYEDITKTREIIKDFITHITESK